ncbi:MAG: FadR/GntR family transcriptional regulator [Anaerolineales bacterium]|nr:MAG: FadR/GntR family transcriptional regulator [Anaerolineales bacterium]
MTTTNRTRTGMNKSAAEYAFQQLLARIQDEAVKVGDKLPSEPILCKELEVGRGTLREASRILRARGYLEIRPGKGAFVVSKTGMNGNELAKWFTMNESKIKDILQVRMALEPMTVRLAISRCNEEDVAALHSIHDCAIKAAAEKNSAQLAMCDENFHIYITQCSRNKMMIEIVKNVNNILKDFRGKTFLVDENIENFIPAHEKILEAFKKKDPEAGSECMRQHLTMVMQDLDSNKEGL